MVRKEIAREVSTAIHNFERTRKAGEEGGQPEALRHLTDLLANKRGAREALVSKLQER